LSAWFSDACWGRGQGCPRSLLAAGLALAFNRGVRGASLQHSTGDTLRDIKPPVELPDPWKWAMIALVVLIVAAAAYLLWREWRKRKAQIPAIPVLPAHVRARRKLEEALGLISQPREFCIVVSDTIRG